MHVWLSVSSWLVCMCVLIPDRGWEPCFVPAWLINGVVMAVGRNEGTERRRSASQDPRSRPGTHTVSNTNTNSTLHALHCFDSHVSRSNKAVRFLFLHPDSIASLKLYFSSLFMSQNFVSLPLFLTCVLTSSPETFLCSSSLLLYIVGPLPFLPVAPITSCPPSAHHHHLLPSPSLPFCPLLPPPALPDVTRRLSGLLLKSKPCA